MPFVVKVWSYVASMPDKGGLSQPVFVGEQNWPSAFPFVPLTTLWPGESQTQCTVSPT